MFKKLRKCTPLPQNSLLGHINHAFLSLLVEYLLYPVTYEKCPVLKFINRQYCHVTDVLSFYQMSIFSGTWHCHFATLWWHLTLSLCDDTVSFIDEQYLFNFLKFHLFHNEFFTTWFCKFINSFCKFVHHIMHYYHQIARVYSIYRRMVRSSQGSVD